MNQYIFPRPEVVSAVQTQWRSLAADAHRVAPTLARELTEWVATVLGPRPEDAFAGSPSPLGHAGHRPVSLGPASTLVHQRIPIRAAD